MNVFQSLKLVIPPPVLSLLSFIGTILFVYVCLIAFSILLSLLVIVLFCIVCEYVWTPIYERSRGNNPDPEAGDEDQRLFQPNSYDDNDHGDWHDQATFYQAAVLHNLRVLDILDSIVQVLEERRDQRQQREREQVVENKMPPPVTYGSLQVDDGMNNCKDCVICMEDFKIHHLCQVFPSCNHTFHSECMNTWLKKSLTCPICRNCVLDL